MGGKTVGGKTVGAGDNSVATVSACERLVGDILAQSAHAYTHSRLVSEWSALSEQYETPIVVSALRAHIDRIIVARFDSSALRIVAFIASAVADDNGAIIRHVVERSAVIDSAVRYNAVTILNRIMSAVDALDDTIIHELRKALMIRAVDRAPHVRASAVSALRHLIDDDGAVAAVMTKRLTDPSAQVRLAAVQSTPIGALCAADRDALILRIRDVAKSVRAAAFQRIADDIPVVSLSIRQRATLIRAGVHDRDETVRAAVATMIGAWIAAYDGDVHRLIGALAVTAFKEECASALHFVIKRGIKHTTASPPYTHVTQESALYWRVRLELADDEERAQLVPETVRLCALIAQHADFATAADVADTNAFILFELTSIAAFVDAADEAGRRSLSGVLRGIMCAVVDSDFAIVDALIPKLTSALRRQYAAEDDFLSDVKCSLLQPLYDSAHQHHDGVTDTASPSALIDYVVVSIVSSALSIQSRMSDAAAELTSRYAVAILSTSDADYAPRLPAIRCVALLTLLMNAEAAMHNANIFIAALQTDTLQVQCEALHALIDALMTFPALSHVVSDDSPLYARLSALVEQYDSERVDEHEAALSNAAVLGTCKLLLADIITATAAPIVLSQLFAVFFDDANAECGIVQTLAVFFDAYAATHSQHIVDAFIPTLQLISGRRAKSALAPAQFLAHLISADDVQSKRLVFIAANYLIAFPSSQIGKSSPPPR